VSRVAARRAVVLLGSCAFLLSVSPHAFAQEAPDVREAYLVVVDDATMEELLSVAPFRSLATVGGAGLLSDRLPLREIQPYLIADVGGPSPSLLAPVTGLVYDDEGSLAIPPRGFAVSRALDLADRIRAELAATPADEVLLIVASASPPARSEAAGDELSGIVLASGRPDALAEALASAGEGEAGTLTSDSTRTSGVVTTRDVAETVLSFLGQPSAGGDPSGSTIRVVDGPPPFALHERYLAQRRLYVPVGTAAALYLTAVGLLGVAFVAVRRPGPRDVRRAVGWACLSVALLTTGMLAAGHLPELTYGTVVPFIAIVTVLGTMAFSPLERTSPVLVPAGIGVAVLAFFVIEAVLGWSAMRTPMLGGTHLDGGRFYGLPNVAIGLLAGASLWVAQRLETWPGVGLIVVAALLAGMPYAGSNLGGGVTLFATAGMWLAVRERERLGAWKGIGVVVLLTVAGTGAILLAHRLAPLPTHITRFEETAGGLGDVWATFVDRLGVGFDLIRGNPAALVPVVGLPLALIAVLRPPASVRSTFERWPAWRDAVLVSLLAGVVAYLANDTGPAAAGLAFGLGLGGMLGVSLLAGPGKMGGS
jgi:hypothetical protein